MKDRPHGGDPIRTTAEPIRVLFLCLHNSARSQMAEGLLRHIGGDAFESLSAGSEPTTRVRPLAIEAMRERGIDITAQYPKTLEVYLTEKFDYVVTTCDEAREACPVFPGAKRVLHWRFDDPSQATGTPEEQLGVYRRILGEIDSHIQPFVTTASHQVGG